MADDDEIVVMEHDAWARAVRQQRRFKLARHVCRRPRSVWQKLESDFPFRRFKFFIFRSEKQLEQEVSYLCPGVTFSASANVSRKSTGRKRVSGSASDSRGSQRSSDSNPTSER